MLKALKKIDNRYVIDFKEHEILINPKQPAEKKYNIRVKLGDEIYYFKGNGVYSYDRAELFCGQIAKEVDLKTIDPVPAYYVDENGNRVEGILSKDYIENRNTTEVISGYQLLKFYADVLKSKTIDFQNLFKEKISKEETINLRVFNNIKSYAKALKILKKALKEFNSDVQLEIDENLINDLCKYQIFYFLTCNEDCYAHNIEFVLTKTQKNVTKIELAPLTDNSISLLIKSFKFENKDMSSKMSDDKLDSIVKSTLEKIRMPLSVLEKQSKSYGRSRIAIEIARLLNSNSQLKEFYLKLKSINIGKLFEFYKHKNDFNFISNTDVKIASLAYKNAIKELENGLNYCRLFYHPNNTETNQNMQRG